ncbi:serine-rich adhesin for platelets-like [Haliotis asinina]|uniref:serine-rich adhesin for platelets-like n=1 Tax=Haliotis asinina TaxID=109174 RepID=UPI003531B813
MDELFATNTGPPATAGDGAFERFLTAAIAAIITIMFSWRLLATEENLGGGEGAVGGTPVSMGREVPKVVMKKAIKMAKAAGYTEESKQLEKEQGLSEEGKKDDFIGSGSGVNTVTSPDLHSEQFITCWEERPRLNDDEEGLLERTQLKGLSTEAEMDVGVNGFSRGNPEYRDILDDDRYRPFDGGAEFGDNTEPRELDSDEEMYCGTMLETIMEEDSDDMCSTSTGSDADSLGRTGEFGYYELNAEGDYEGDHAEEGGCTVHVMEDGSELSTSVITIASGATWPVRAVRDEFGDNVSYDEPAVASSSEGTDNRYDAQRKSGLPPGDTADDSNSDGSDESVVTVVTRQLSEEKESPINSQEFSFTNTGQIEIVPVRTRATSQVLNVAPVSVQSTFQAIQPDEPYPTDDQHTPATTAGVDEGLQYENSAEATDIPSPSQDSGVYSIETRVDDEKVRGSLEGIDELEEKFDINSNVDPSAKESDNYSASRNASRVLNIETVNKESVESDDSVNENARRLNIVYGDATDVPDYKDAYVSSAVEKTPKGFIFSRFELETTDYEEKVYTTDRATHTVVAKLVAEEKFIPTEQTDADIREQFANLGDGDKIETSPKTFAKAGSSRETNVDEIFETDSGSRPLILRPGSPEKKRMHLGTENKQTNIADPTKRLQRSQHETNIDDHEGLRYQDAVSHETNGITKHTLTMTDSAAPPEKFLRMDKTDGSRSHRIVPLTKETSDADRVVKTDGGKSRETNIGDTASMAKRLSSASQGESPPEKILRIGSSKSLVTVIDDSKSSTTLSDTGKGQGLLGTEKTLTFVTESRETITDSRHFSEFTMSQKQSQETNKLEDIHHMQQTQSRETLIDDPRVSGPRQETGTIHRTVNVKEVHHDHQPLETRIDDIASIVSQELNINKTSKETLIDDVPTSKIRTSLQDRTGQRETIRGRETVIDDVISSESEELKTNRTSKETLIDGVPASKVHTSLQDRTGQRETSRSRETVIDDVANRVSQELNTNKISRETLIDDVPASKIRTSLQDRTEQSDTPISRETVIDDVGSTSSTRFMTSGPVKVKSPAHGSQETLIDDVVSKQIDEKRAKAASRESLIDEIDMVLYGRTDYKMKPIEVQHKIPFPDGEPTHQIWKPSHEKVDSGMFSVGGHRETLIDDPAVSRHGLSKGSSVKQETLMHIPGTRETLIDDNRFTSTEHMFGHEGVTDVADGTLNVETPGIYETNIDDVSEIVLPERVLNIDQENVKRFRNRASLNREGSSEGLDESNGNELDKSFGDVTNRSEDMLDDVSGEKKSDAVHETQIDADENEEEWVVDEVVQDFTIMTGPEGQKSFIPGKMEHRIIHLSPEHKPSLPEGSQQSSDQAAQTSPQYVQTQQALQGKETEISLEPISSDRPTPKPRRSLRSESGLAESPHGADHHMDPTITTQVNPDGKLHLDAIDEVSWKPLSDSVKAENSPAAVRKFVMEDVIISGSHLIPRPRRQVYSEADKSNPLVAINSGDMGSYGTRSNLAHLSKDLESEGEIDFEMFAGGVNGADGFGTVIRPASESSPKHGGEQTVADGNESPDDSGFPSPDVSRQILEQFKRSKSVEHLRRKSWGMVDDESVFMPMQPKKSDSPVLSSSVQSPPIIPDSPVVSPPSMAFLMSKKGSKSVPNLVGIDDSPSIKAPISHTRESAAIVSSPVVQMTPKAGASPLTKKPSRYTKKYSTTASSPVIKAAAKAKASDSQQTTRQVIHTDIDDVVDSAAASETAVLSTAGTKSSSIEKKSPSETTFSAGIESSPVISQSPLISKSPVSMIPASPMTRHVPAIVQSPTVQLHKTVPRSSEFQQIDQSSGATISKLTGATPIISAAPKIESPAITSSPSVMMTTVKASERIDASPLISSPSITMTKDMRSFQPVHAPPLIEESPSIPVSPTIKASERTDASPLISSPSLTMTKDMRSTQPVHAPPLIEESPSIPISPTINVSERSDASPLISSPSVTMTKDKRSTQPVHGPPLIVESPSIPVSPTIKASERSDASPLISSPSVTITKDKRSTQPVHAPTLIEESPSIPISPTVKASERIDASPLISSPSVTTMKDMRSTQLVHAPPLIEVSPSIPISPTVKASERIDASPLIEESPSIPVSAAIKSSERTDASPSISTPTRSSTIPQSPTLSSPLIPDSPVIATSPTILQSPSLSAPPAILASPTVSIPDSPPVSMTAAPTEEDTSFEDQWSFGSQKKHRSLKEIKRKYSSKNFKSMQMPPTPNIGQFVVPPKSVLTARHKINAYRKRFLSEGNLLDDSESQLNDQFNEHKESLTTKYKSPRRPGQKTPSSYRSQDNLERFTLAFPNFLLDDSSEGRPSIDELHKNCIFTPEGRKDIMNKTLSIENLSLDLGAHLRRYGSVTSLYETDIDTGETSETIPFPETDLDLWFSLQHPIERAVSMTDLRSEHSHRIGTGKGRFAHRNVPKSKSLQTLETNLDDEEDELKRVPSVHELRVTKSLSKLNIPDWFKNSSLSKSGSCILRHGSTSTMSSWGFNPSLTSSPCPSVTSTGNVVIKTRVSPSSSMRLFKSPKFASVPTLPKTPEERLPKAPIKLPSEMLKKSDKPKALEKIPIVPFAQIRAMFEAKAANERARMKDSAVRQDSVSSKVSVKAASPVPVVTVSPSEIVVLESSPKRPRSPPVIAPDQAKISHAPVLQKGPSANAGDTSQPWRRPLSPSTVSPQRPLSPTETTIPQRTTSPLGSASSHRSTSPTASTSPQRPLSPAESSSPRSISPLGQLSGPEDANRSFSPSDRMRPINPDGPHNRSMSSTGSMSPPRSISPGGILSPRGYSAYGNNEQPASPESPPQSPVEKGGPKGILGPTVRFVETEKIEIKDNKPSKPSGKKTDFFKRLQVFQRSDKDKKNNKAEDTSKSPPQKQVPATKLKSAFEPFSRNSKSIESAPTIQAPNSRAAPKSPTRTEAETKLVEEAPVLQTPNSQSIESAPTLKAPSRMATEPARNSSEIFSHDRNSHTRQEPRNGASHEPPASPVRVGNPGQSLPTPVLTPTPFSRSSTSEEKKRSMKETTV